MPDLGAFGTAKPADETTFGWFGATLRISPGFGELELADFLEAAASVDDSDAVGSMALLKGTMRTLLHESDFDEFWRLAKANRQGVHDLMLLLHAAVEAVVDTPTERPSGSPDGPGSTNSSLVDVRLSVVSRLEDQGRPDLARMVPA